MTPGCCTRRLLALGGRCLMVLALLVALPAAGQSDRLNPSLVSNNSSWTAEQRAEVESFVAQHVQGLLAADEGQVRTSKEALSNPFNTAGSTDRFKTQFSDAIIAGIGPALSASELKPRINAMLVCTQLTSAGALEPITQGLNDVSPGVRYPAAMAVANLLRQNEQITPAKRREVLQQLENLVDNENDPFVVQQLLGAMVQTGDATRVITALNRRLDWHVFRADASYDPERDALQAVYTRLFIATSQPPDEVKQLARAAARYWLLAAQQLDQGAVAGNNQRSHFDIIRTAYSALEFAAANQRSTRRKPEDPARFIIQKDSGALVRIANEWIELLKQDPFNFTAEQLTVTEEGAPTP